MTTELSLIKPSSVKLRKLSKADIQLWTMANTSTRSKAPSKVTQTFTPIKPRRAIIASVSHNSKKQTKCKQPLRKTSSNKSSSVRSRTSNKSTTVLQFLRSQVAELPGHRKYEKE